MKKSLIYISFLLLLILIFANVSYGVMIYPPRSYNDTYKILNQDNGQSCFIFGGFSLVHTLDPTLAEPAISNVSENIDRSCNFFMRVHMRNTDTGQTTIFLFKPVTGSSKYYYPNSDKKLDENAKDPYWVAQLPEGNYEITNLSCGIILKKQGFEGTQFNLFDTPTIKLFNKKISFATGLKQFIYIGDFNATLISNVFLKDSRQILPYYKFEINLVNDYKTAKDKFINNAFERVKEKLKDYSFVSIL